MKKTTYQCDKCGLEMSRNVWVESPAITVKSSDKVIGKHDLCVVCYEKLKRYIATP